MAAETQQRPFVLPGDRIDQSLIPSNPKKALRLGPGLRHIPPNELVPTVAGQLVTDWRKNSIWVEYNGGRVSSIPYPLLPLPSTPLLLRAVPSVLICALPTNRIRENPQYIPSQGDLVIGTVQKTSGDYLYVSLGEHTSNALLPSLAFESASKKTRPNLAPGQLVYARVSLANRHMDPELECVSPATGKADGLGPLGNSTNTGGGGVGMGMGMVYGVSLGMARRLLMRRSAEEGGVVVLEELGAAGLAFETAVGRNGRIWVNSESTKTVLAVGRAVQETDEKNLSVEQQKKLVRKLVKEIS
ncbi:hypothetical protein DL765_008970 [Monosporascus sp. GIB2]|nr:hypothetical protein DL765_008970 [Monosporascus sp. GIB2]